MKKYFILFFVCIIALPAFAEALKFKDGKVVEGKIVEETNQYIKMDVGIGVDVTYYKDELETPEVNNKEIVKEVKKSVMKSSPSSIQEPNLKVYSLNLKGSPIKISLPIDWQTYNYHEDDGHVMFVNKNSPSEDIGSGCLMIIISKLDLEAGSDPASCKSILPQSWIFNAMKEETSQYSDVSESREFFDVVSLISGDLKNHDNTPNRSKNIWFIKNCNTNEISFTYHREQFTEEWDKIKKYIKNIEFNE